MTFKSTTQPLCRCCGKPIAKHATEVRLTLKRAEYQQDRWGTRYVEVKAFPKTKAECQKMTNEKVLSVKRTEIRDSAFELTGESHIESFGVWDGESYRDQFFCNRTQCAVNYAYMVVQKTDLVSVAYNDAVKRQKGEKVS